MILLSGQYKRVNKMNPTTNSVTVRLSSYKVDSMEKSYDFNVWSDVTPKQLRQFSLIISKLVMLHNWENIPCTQDNLRKAQV